MAATVINVNLEPKEVLNLIEEKLKFTKKELTTYKIGFEKYIITAVYEKNFNLTGSIGTLVVTVDNTSYDGTKVKMLSAGKTSDLFIFENPKGLIKKANKVLKEYIF